MLAGGRPWLEPPPQADPVAPCGVNTAESAVTSRVHFVQRKRRLERRESRELWPKSEREKNLVFRAGWKGWEPTPPCSRATIGASGSGPGAGQVSPGVTEMPYFCPGEEARRFLECCRADGWVLYGFDWVEWASSEEAQGLMRDAQKVAAARPRQLARLLTMLIRRDRFCEGTLNVAFASGLLAGIVGRAAHLAAALARGDEEEIEGAW
jgi:hypothetical protein